MNDRLLSESGSHSSFRDEMNRLLICPVTGQRLDRPHVIKITKPNCQEIILTVSGSVLTSLPNAFEANKPNARLVTYDGISYEVEPCFDRVTNDLLASLSLAQDDDQAKACVGEALRCPITSNFFDGPVITSTGYTYSQAAWNQWTGQNPGQDMNRATVTFIYQHELLVGLLGVYRQHYLDQQTAEMLVSRPEDSVYSDPARLSTVHCMALSLPVGEAGFLAFLAWFCAGCNSHSLALKLGIGGGVGCFIGLLAAELLYGSCTTREEREQDCASLYNGCGVCFYPCFPREAFSGQVVSLGMHS